jgi:hypothetical protein
MAADCLAHQVRGVVCIASPLAGVPLITSWLGGVPVSVPAPRRAAASCTAECAEPGDTRVLDTARVEPGDTRVLGTARPTSQHVLDTARPMSQRVLDTARPMSQPVGWGPIGMVIILGYILEIVIGWSATVREYVCG